MPTAIAAAAHNIILGDDCVRNNASDDKNECVFVCVPGCPETISRRAINKYVMYVILLLNCLPVRVVLHIDAADSRHPPREKLKINKTNNNEPKSVQQYTIIIYPCTRHEVVRISTGREHAI